MVNSFCNFILKFWFLNLKFILKSYFWTCISFHIRNKTVWFTWKTVPYKKHTSHKYFMFKQIYYKKRSWSTLQKWSQNISGLHVSLHPLTVQTDKKPLNFFINFINISRTSKLIPSRQFSNVWNKASSLIIVKKSEAHIEMKLEWMMRCFYVLLFLLKFQSSVGKRNHESLFWSRFRRSRVEWSVLSFCAILDVNK